jgi:hypothetical protein
MLRKGGDGPQTMASRMAGALPSLPAGRPAPLPSTRPAHLEHGKGGLVDGHDGASRVDDDQPVLPLVDAPKGLRGV